jgi:hypothetical protein
VRSSAEPRRGAAPGGSGNVALAAPAPPGLEADRGDSAAPHSEQKFCPGAVSCPQSGHDVESAAPHSMQNFAPG